MSVAPSTGPRGDRIPLVAGAMVAILVLIGARVAQLTILDHADLARRALDYLVGFRLSPVLWRNRVRKPAVTCRSHHRPCGAPPRWPKRKT